jgi:hypothetical protein
MSRRALKSFVLVVLAWVFLNSVPALARYLRLRNM